MKKSAIKQAIKINALPISTEEKAKMLAELIEVEREQVAAAWLEGNRQGWEMNTDWPEHGYVYYDENYAEE